MSMSFPGKSLPHVDQASGASRNATLVPPPKGQDRAKGVTSDAPKLPLFWAKAAGFWRFWARRNAASAAAGRMSLVVANGSH